MTENISNITGKKIDYEIVNNYDFHKDLNVLDYLKEVGRYITVNWMISKDIVKKRITEPDKWISYAEFSYMLIMGYDYYYLWKNRGVTLEVGGSDEWDGILAGIELVSKKDGGEVYGVTNKLITDANGKKFGKSEGNAVWLDETKTSPYEVYQYFINTLDEDIEKYLKLLSLLSEDEISEIVNEHKKSPEKRYGQRTLAKIIVEMVHGKEQSEASEKISEFLFGEIPHPTLSCEERGKQSSKLELLKSLSPDEFEVFFSEIGGIEFSEQNLFGLFIETELEKSGTTTRQSLSSGALFINEEKITDGNYDFSSDFIDGKFLLLRKGKKNYRIIKK